MTTATTAPLQPYETLFIVPAETAQDKIDAFVEKLKATIVKDQGQFRSAQMWGRRRLAYPIKNNKDGFYVYVDFDGKNSTASEVSHSLRVADLVIRHMTVQREEPPVIKPKVSATTPGTATATEPKIESKATPGSGEAKAPTSSTPPSI